MSVTTVSQSRTQDGKATRLEHHHREGEDVSFFVVFPLVEDFRRGPSRGVAVFT